MGVSVLDFIGVVAGRGDDGLAESLLEMNDLQLLECSEWALAVRQFGCWQ